VICGIFGFLTLEKVFSEEKDDDNSNTKKEKEGKVRIPWQWYNACNYVFSSLICTIM